MRAEAVFTAPAFRLMSDRSTDFERRCLSRSGALVCLCVLLSFAQVPCAADTVVVPHVAGGGWATTLTAYNPSSTGQPFTYTPYSDGGAPGAMVSRTVPGLGSVELSAPADLSDQGSGRVESTGALAFTLRYRYGNSLSVCDFTLSETEATGWMLPNPKLDWFSWVGVALVNPNSSQATVTLRAFKNGSIAGARTVAVSAQAKTTGMSTELWGLGPSEFDWVHVLSDLPLSAPIVISGSADQDRHLFAAGIPAALSLAASASTVVDTGQTLCFDTASEIAAPDPGQAFYGQDAQFSGTRPSYTKSGDGHAVHDDVTGLTWQQSPDTNGDGTINAADKLSWADAQARPAALNAAKYGGYGDWRLPDIKELYSLMNFMGTDVGPGSDISTLTPFIDRAYFAFAYGDTSAGERVIDAQYASSTLYVSTTMLGDTTLFGVNFADGRIKGYGLTAPGGGEKTFFVQCVRGAACGVNDFVDNGDGTVTDRATALMWSKGDSATGLNWQEALAWAQTKSAENYLGHGDWRLPNAKELQSIVDYTRSPDTTSSAAIDPLFACTGITNEAGKADYPFYWTGTTHMSSSGVHANAIYIAFGRALGYMTDPTGTIGAWLDVHGAGAQRSDPKAGNPADFPKGRGPQGDAIRIYNYVRLVRDAR